MDYRTGLVVGVDLGGTKVCAGVLQPGGRVSGVRTVPTNADKGADYVSERIANLVKAVSGKRAVSAVGVGVPGQVHRHWRRVRNAPHLKGFSNYPLADVLEGVLGAPVILGNDATCFTLAECRLGAGRGYGRVLGVTLGTGIGGGICENGRIAPGSHNAAGEIGHTLLEFDGRQCECGARGCLEQYASGTALDRAAARLGLKGGAFELARNASKGDERCMQEFRIMGRFLGAGLASACNLVDPDAVVLGGSASNSFRLFRASMQKEFNARCLAPTGSVAIVTATLKYAGVAGAALLPSAATD